MMRIGNFPGTRAGIAALAMTMVLAGCAQDRGLINVRSDSRGPDEFSILPTKPLELPEDLSALPSPTPGGPNRTDPTPRNDAVAALGGNRAAIDGPVPAADSALVTRATRFGTESGIRRRLAAEDAALRANNRGRLLERVFNITVYYRIYEPQSLDQTRELERWRRAGVRTNSAPPPPDLR